jgi:hypothetical protein
MPRISIRAICKCGADRSVAADTEKECRRELHELGWKWRVIDKHREQFTCSDCINKRDK